MILSEFVLTHKGGDWMFADVTVTTTTGRLWWKKKHVARRRICQKDEDLWNWYFVDTGEQCPNWQVDELLRSYEARGVLSHILKEQS